MSGNRVLRSKTNKNKTVKDIRSSPSAVCANCKQNSTLSKEFVSFDSDDEEEITLTFHEILQKVFQVTFDLIRIPNIIQLCHNCGLQLYKLYKSYEGFLDLCAIDSALSQFIKNKADSSDISIVRPLKIKIRKSKAKKVPKTCRKEKKKSKLKSNLKKDPEAEDVSQTNSSEIGDDHLKMSMPWDSFSLGMDYSDDNLDGMDDIDIEDMKHSPLTFLNDQVVQEKDTCSPSPDSGTDKIAILPIGSPESSTPRIKTPSDEFGRITESVVGPSRKVKRPRTCPVCNKTFQKPIEMRIHLTKKHFVECGVPENRLVRKTVYMRTPHDCGICGKTLASKQSLRGHIKFFHEKQLNYTCQICNIKCATKSSLEIHSRTHTGQKIALCSVCGRGFSSKANLKAHFDRHFSNSASVSSKYKGKCKLCLKTFRSTSQLEYHMLEHENQRTFICDICGNSYNTGKSLRNHKSAHIDQFPCPYCERTFKRKAALKDHLISSAHALSLEQAKAAAGIFSKRIDITDAN